MPGDVEAGIAEIRRRMQALGRDPSGLWVGTSLTLGVDPDSERAVAHHSGVEREAVTLQTPDDVVAEVERLRAAGVTYFTTSFNWADAGDLLRQMEQFATELMPLCKRDAS
jgi:alkanesulfonate monooxygenase SsuD/methylene tetrahydromethanopterin reductase-like flavin-dependent oxidoreductase (luciferase family)